MIDTQRLKQIDLKSFLSKNYGLSFDSRGFTHCPFHTPDNNPSFKVTQENGRGGQWFDFHCPGDRENFSSDIIGFVMRKDGIPFVEASKKIEELEGLDKPAIRTPRKYAEISENDILRTFHYHDESGNILFQKIRLKETSPHFKSGKFSLRRKVNGRWAVARLTDEMKDIPYRLHQIKDEQTVFLCEGERDSESLVALGYQATTAPWGMGSWRNELTPHFFGKEVNIIYDVGNEKARDDVAEKLSKSCTPWISSIPLKERESDITDYLFQFPDNETKKAKFEEEVLRSREKFSQQIIEQRESRDSEGVWARTVKFITEELDHGQFFTLYELCQHLGFIDPQDRKKASRAISHLVSRGEIKKGERLGTWKKAPAKLVALDLMPDSEEKYLEDFTMPLLGQDVKVARGDLLLISGFTSTGKTAYATNVALQNQSLFPGVDFFSTQAGQVRQRIRAFKIHQGLEKESWKMKLYERTEEYASIINPDNLTIIDFPSRLNAVKERFSL